ncbi:MAG: carbamate kinase [Bacilli bacterium]|jgi:carbamate kinase|nr:carbamate kinase [Bacilli bacterium]MDD3121037.1 carbamate kinase [Bacilli bacterium]MDD4063211.1 carbamate kinase [Bacilli bacterium]MDY0364087.1 carbamate kinase [Bacilli bacterium]
MGRFVISLGGNALGNNAEEQQKLLEKVAEAIVPLIEKGEDIVIVHGNGPQVGMINSAFSALDVSNQMPFAECGAMSQGYIGFHIQKALQNILKQKKIDRNIVTLVTQVLVDKNDPAFLTPTKPIGSFYNKEEADFIAKEKNYVMKEDSGRGYRRVVASPKPIDIIEKESILSLLEKHHIVIAAGGGGIPVIEDKGVYRGIDAVIDKDYASAKMAEIILADELIILTAVDFVYINYNSINQEKINKVTLIKLKKYIEEGHFKEGSMLPKVLACMDFVEKTKRTAIIASLDNAALAFEKEQGTKIIY